MRRKINKKTEKNINKKGFTLVELLTIIVIITLVAGIASYSIINIINNSKKESLAISTENLKDAANNYTKETKNIVWKIPEGASTNSKISCVTVNDLINKGYFDKKILEKEEFKKITHIIVEKNLDNDVIINEYFDTENTCNQNYIYIDTPKCNENLEYDSTNKTLIKNSNIEGYEKIDGGEQKDAGTYQVKISLKEGYAWKNGTLTPYQIKCKIKKAKTTIRLNPNAETNNNQTKYQFEATPHITNPTLNSTNTITGTIKANSSNTEYVKINSIEKNELINKERTKINLIAQSSREAITEVKVTFTPNGDYAKNYDKSTATFKLASKNITNSHKITLEPNEDIGEFNKTFTVFHGYAYEDNLITPETHGYPKKEGYTFTGWFTKETGGTQKYANDIVTNSHTLYGQWKEIESTVYFDPNGGTLNSSEESKKVIYDSTYGPLPIPTRTGYTFNGWFTETKGGNQIKETDTVKITENQTLYADWTPITYQVHYIGQDYTSQTYNDNTQCNDSGQCGLNRYISGSTFESNTFKHAANHEYDTSWNLIYTDSKKQDIALQVGQPQKQVLLHIPINNQ